MKKLCLLLPFAVLVWISPTHAASPVVISEFMASNSRTLADEDGTFEDWIEIRNVSTNTVNLAGWALTDAIGDLGKWQFPATNLPPNGYLVVFASNKDRRIPGARLHTNFRLTAGGEYLALVEPDGVTIASQFAPTFPGQVQDVSFGFGLLTSNTMLLVTGAPVRVLVPTAENGGTMLNYTWMGAATNEPFADAAWRSGVTGVGFSVGAALVAPTSMTVRFNFEAMPVGNVIVDSKPSGTLRNGINNGATWLTSSTDNSPTLVIRAGVMQFNATESDQITLAASPEFNTNRGTIMFWMRSAGVTGGGSFGAMLVDRRASVGVGTGDVIVQQDDGSIFVQASSGGGTIVNTFSTPTSVSDNRWHHIAYVYDQTSTGSIAIYIDGVLSRSQNNSAAWSWTPSQPFELGRSHDPFWRRFNGWMDDFRIYNRRLNAPEIAAIYGGDGGVAPADIGTDIAAEMLNMNASAFLRIPFTVENPTNFSLLTLRLKYDDGFVAWINGQEVARGNAPASIGWNSAATTTHPASVAESITIANPSRFLRTGPNVLAIQGLNLAAENNTFLISPELSATTAESEATNGAYFTTPSPGRANVGGAAVPGPTILDASHTPEVPRDAEDLFVTARVTPTFYAVSNVTLRYRIMYASEISLTMFDDGAHSDGAAGDGIFGAVILANASTNGQMIRYFISATDVRTNVSRWPLFTDPANSAQFLGTIVSPTNLTSKLPIFHLFVNPANQGAADGEAGSRCSFFYDGEFYDNIHIEVRGNTTAGLLKKSHRIEFNREHPLRHPGPGERIRKTSLMAEYIDPSYVRQYLSFWLMTQSGHDAPFHYPVRVQNNGVFYQFAFHSEVLGEEQLDRFGRDPEGALYKAVGVVAVTPCSTGGGPEKTTREFEPSLADYTALAVAVANTVPVARRRTNLFDIIDIPNLINYFAVSRLTHEQDDVWANLSLYRDSDGDLLWRVIPFDLNLSWGQLYGVGTIQAANDSAVSHPFYGASTVQVGGACSGFNHLFDAMIQIPETRQMYLRRLRSVMDTFLQPPGTPMSQGVIEQHVIAMTNLFYSEAILDRQRWGWPPPGSGPAGLPVGIWLTNGVAGLFNQFINPRRVHLYGTHCVTNTARAIGLAVANNAGIPLAQPFNAVIRIGAIEFNPGSGNQGQEYIGVTNPGPFAVDISGWKLDGGIEFTFEPGTVIPSNGVLYVARDIVGFRTRASGPRSGQGLFVIGNFRGQLSARGETLRVRNQFGQVVHSLSYPGTPSLAQQFLRISEIMYHPSPLSGNTNSPEEFEYVELRNISTNATLDLHDVRLTNGIAFSFADSAVTSLAPGQTVLVVKNLAAFTARYGAGFNVAGSYAGLLENAGERLQLLDAAGEEILDFSYDNNWYPLTDGLGFSLVVVDENAEPDAWSTKANWRASGQPDGSPGIEDPTPPAIAPVLISEVLARTEMPPPTDSIELNNPTGTSANIGGWFLTDDFKTPKKFRIPEGTILGGRAFVVFDESHFNPGGTGFALSSDGDEVYLFSANLAGELTGYVHGFQFGAAEDGVSFGRHVISTGDEHFVAQTALSLNASNTGPRIGPVVISEIMYHPPDNGTNDNAEDEFIELLNISAQTVTLFETGLPTNVWKLTGDVDFVLPSGLSLAPGETLLLVNFDPTNPAVLATFRAKYRINEAVRLFGPYTGKLNNTGGNLELKKSTTPLAGNVPFVVVDEVRYTDALPWPAGADGFGLSLQRKESAAYGNDPANWIAARPTAGEPTQPMGAPPTITVHPQSQQAVAFQNATLAVSASGATPFDYQWRINGVNISGATNTVLQLINIHPAQAGEYEVVVFNAAGSAVSSNATLTLIYPASILAQPQSVGVRPGLNATFSVVAYSTTPLRYQWRKNDIVITGATNVTLTLTNVGLADPASYSVMVTDELGSITSVPAQLVVLIDPIIVQSPVSASVPEGGSVTLSVAVTNTATSPLTYRWRRNVSIIFSNTLDSAVAFFTVTNVQGTNTWTVLVSNAARPGGNLSASATIIALPDTDRDGIPDAWENAHGLNPNSAADREADSDEDSMKNWGEYVAGTNPTNASSYLRIERISGAGSAMLQFQAASNQTYTVQFGEDLSSGTWSKLADIPARATNRVELIVDPTFTTNRFYRLATPQQP